LGEGSETINLQLNNPNGASADPNKSTATLTIIDNDAAPVVGFSQASYTVNENGTSAQVTVTLNSTAGNDVTVDYATSNGTATAGMHFHSWTMRFSWARSRST
jgi:hypothetical protein